MKLIPTFSFLFIFLFFAYISHAQYTAPFAIIKDKDGFTNVRSAQLATSKVIDTLKENEVFEDLNLAPINEGSKSDWHMITFGKHSKNNRDFSRTSKESGGYIHKSRIQYLKDLPQLTRQIKDSTISFTNDSIKIVIQTGKFIPQEHRLIYTDHFLSKIDSQEPWGIDGALLKNLAEIKSVTIYYKGNKLIFPKSAVTNLLQPTPENMHVAVSNDNTIFLTMSNSDGAGAYNTVWTIKNGAPIRQFVNRDF